MTERFEYDVFISHSFKDKPAVSELAERLKNDGLRVWFDEWEIAPGDMIGLRIQKGLEQSRILLLVMSANASESEWVTFESQAILFSDPTNQQRRFIPLRLDDAEIKDALKQFAYVDWRERSVEQYARLVAACRPMALLVETAIKEKDEIHPGKIFAAHKDYVQGVAITADGRRVVTGSADKTVCIWDVETGKCIAMLEGHTQPVYGVAITPDGQRTVSGSFDSTVMVWDTERGSCLATLGGHVNTVTGVAITADGRQVVSGSADKTVRVWSTRTHLCIAMLEGHTDSVLGVAVTADGWRVVSGSADKTVRVWDTSTGKCIATLVGHTQSVLRVAVTSDGRLVVSGSLDKTVRVWDVETGKCIATLEGHTDSVLGVAVTVDGRRIVSGSADKTVRAWDRQTGKCIATLTGHANMVYSVAVTPDGRRAISGSLDTTARIWELPPYEERDGKEFGATRYTNAKVLLVGETGVGKTGLAIRLTEDRFEPTISTDAAWATQLKLPHEIGNEASEREIWLWDFAGQADYRLIHRLFMDETSLAVLVFNPQSENPFEGLGQWDRDLERAARRPFRKLLVAGRCDRGGPMVSRNNIERFRSERGFAHYLETSAYTGDGCRDLRDAIINNIPWGDISWTASPHIFKLLKEEIVKLKDEGRVLLRMGEMKQQLEMRLSAETFTLEQLGAVVGLLAGPGIVWQLEFGDFVLLQPELINAYAGAVIRKVRAHPEEIGVILEKDVLDGKLDYQSVKRLARDEEQIVLRAMHQTFIDHGLCLREPTELGTLLVFPSYFKRERPEQPDHPQALVTYRFSGPLEEIYATLVVKLRHTAAFNIDDTWLWRFAADFKTQANKRVGFYMVKKAEGEAELTVYCEISTAEDTKVTFIRYIHDHLKSKDPNVTRVRHYFCTNAKCGESVENARTVERALEGGKSKIYCSFCGKKILLIDLIEEKFDSEKIRRGVREMDEKSRITIDNESRELLLAAHALAVTSEAGQIFKAVEADWGIDGEIEFKNDKGQPSGRRVYLQLRPVDSYLQTRSDYGKAVFNIKDPRHAEYWQAQTYPMMLVMRTADGQIRWMNVTDYLRQHGTRTRQIIFDGEPFTALSVIRLKDSLFR